MGECTNTRNLQGAFQCLEQTGKSDDYRPWHSHDSAPQMRPYIGLAEEPKKKKATMDDIEGPPHLATHEVVGPIGRPLHGVVLNIARPADVPTGGPATPSFG